MDPAATPDPGTAPAGWYPATGAPGLFCYWDGQRWSGPPVLGPFADPRDAAIKNVRTLFAWSVSVQLLLGLAWILALFVIVFTKLSGWDGQPLVEDYPSWLRWYGWYPLVAPIAAGVSITGRNNADKARVIAATVMAAVPVVIGWLAILVAT